MPDTRCAQRALSGVRMARCPGLPPSSGTSPAAMTAHEGAQQNGAAAAHAQAKGFAWPTRPRRLALVGAAYGGSSARRWGRGWSAPRTTSAESGSRRSTPRGGRRPADEVVASRALRRTLRGMLRPPQGPRDTLWSTPLRACGLGSRGHLRVFRFRYQGGDHEPSSHVGISVFASARCL